MPEPTPPTSPVAPQDLTRRQVIQGAGAAATAALVAPALAADPKPDAAAARRKGRIKQSIVQWCFEAFGGKWNTEQQAKIARDLGCLSVELGGPEGWPILKRHGLTCAIASNGMPGAPFMRGLNNPAYQPEVIERTSKMIETSADAGVPSVIAFTGYKWVDVEDDSKGAIPPDEGAKNCVAGLKKLAALAEKRGVTVCMEHLNTRASDHPMKGHPGYQGDHIDYCADIIRAVGSPRVKLLFDVYHVQIMDGDVIRRIREYGPDLIGHVHTAGNPGRGELDDSQEINYPPIMRALLEVGYEGYVGQEFIPTRDALAGLRQAVEVCDV